MGLREIRLQLHTGLQLANRFIVFTLLLQRLAEVVMRLRKTRRQANGLAQMIQGSLKRFLLQADHAKMQMGRGEFRLQRQRLRELRASFIETRLLRQQRTQFIVKISSLWLEFHCAFHFLACAFQVSAKTQYPSQGAMSFRAARCQSHRLATLAKCCVEVSFLSKRS